jgi:monofunctional biosynthetic peptidoglycan transglycosylase
MEQRMDAAASNGRKFSIRQKWVPLRSIEKTLIRAVIVEMIIAGRLEDELSKQRILELYLNVIEWGDGIFGVESASMTYFGKHASELSREEAVRLVAVIPSPLKHRPNVDSRFVNFRKRIILARLNARGW